MYIMYFLFGGFVLILSGRQLLPLVVGLCHLFAPVEWVVDSKEFKNLYNRKPPGKDLGNPVLLSFMNYPEFLGAGYFFTDPARTYYRGRRCNYTNSAAARAHLRVGEMYAPQLPSLISCTVVATAVISGVL